MHRHTVFTFPLVGFPFPLSYNTRRACFGLGWLRCVARSTEVGSPTRFSSPCPCSPTHVSTDPPCRVSVTRRTSRWDLSLFTTYTRNVLHIYTYIPTQNENVARDFFSVPWLVLITSLNASMFFDDLMLYTYLLVKYEATQHNAHFSRGITGISRPTSAKKTSTSGRGAHTSARWLPLRASPA